MFYSREGPLRSLSLIIDTIICSLFLLLLIYNLTASNGAFLYAVCQSFSFRARSLAFKVHLEPASLSWRTTCLLKMVFHWSNWRDDEDQ
ncbi:conserved hypothetical protein [Coccidioides posadasii str. Silveira]|uniref:Uncharacterized protein n=1 Tax=Coccidioides posadasii (strain RMSCC 757 / Silveira) TaxID=443226 RepID=E9DDN3_COCPS|nr:conserved hypothetical protein [Coccidioides posadasii str. Silveira]